MQEKSRLIPTYSDDEIHSIQSNGFLWTVNHVWNNSPQYREKFKSVNLEAGDIKSLADLQKLPFTTADDLRDGYPLPLLSVPEKDVLRIHASSGTTGKRKVMAYTKNDVENFSLQVARCYELAGLNESDRVQVCAGYGLWTAGIGFQLGAEKLGAMSLPVGAGNLEIHMQMLSDLSTTCLVCTSSMALLMSEEVERHGLLDKIKLKKIIFGSEAHTEKMRRTFEEKLGIEDSFDIGGMTEMYGPGTSLECHMHTGLHYWADLFIIEVVNPETLQPVVPGEVGEMVVTSLQKEASPLIRYRTRDLSYLVPGKCPCGCNMPRHGKILGRSDDMIIFRGVNIYPGQIASVLNDFSMVGSEYQIELSRNMAKDFMKLRVELSAGQDLGADDRKIISTKIEKLIKSNLLVSCEVEVNSYGNLPRSFGKTRRVIDNRLED